MNMNRIKKDTIVTAIRTFNYKEITGEFQRFRLLNEQNSDSIVGVVYVPNERAYDVFADSIKEADVDERAKMEAYNQLKDINF